VEARYGREVTVIYNGVDTELFRPLPRDPAWRLARGIPAQAPLVAATGRLVGLKGFQVAIGALSQLPDVHLAIAGDGPERGRLEALARDLGMADRLHLLGPLRHAELPQLLNQADLFVLPTIGEETFGISVVEAMACGLPVLVSDTGGLPEVVTDGECGRLLPPGDTRAWHDAIASLLAHPDDARAMGAKGRERAEAEFTWRANAERLEQLILAERAV
jgi:glycosyltransferase involved in cell wall biosynthesis